MTLVKVSNYQSTEAQPKNHNKSYEGYKYNTLAYTHTHTHTHTYETAIVQQETELWTCWRNMNV